LSLSFQYFTKINNVRKKSIITVVTVDFIGFLTVIFIPLVVTYWKRENKPALEKFK